MYSKYVQEGAQAIAALVLRCCTPIHGGIGFSRPTRLLVLRTSARRVSLDDELISLEEHVSSGGLVATSGPALVHSPGCNEISLGNELFPQNYHALGSPHSNTRRVYLKIFDIEYRPPTTLIEQPQVLRYSSSRHLHSARAKYQFILKISHMDES
ncbi:hypothetical protein O181_001699 [Austropuccinia psidii MF-1]|uniref:Uncharacterized protein n=1 Tax=Austropuccinia psidii MF-1 TaxID=1389203 RepID=A0A9Q3BB12_9BASI|nr:hypothetical protein [Austropuccinia psidii MF-1]